jgi:hypothetical protein
LGYFGLFSSVPSTLAANLVQLEYVATFMTTVGFVTQLAPVALIVWGRALIWKSLATRFVGLCILLFNPLGEELWLNTTCIQFHFVIVAFLLLLEPDDALTPRARWVQRGLLAVAGLAGPPPCSLAPLFAGRALVTRSRESFVRAAIIVGAALLQLGVVVYGMTQMIGRSDRFGNGLDFAAVAISSLGKAVIVPFFGVGYGTSFAVMVQHVDDAGPDAYRVLGLACGLLLGFVTYVAARGAPVADRVAYLGAAALLIATSMVLGIGDRHSWVHPVCAARYYYAPGVVFMFFVLSQLDLRSPRSFTPNQRGLALALALGLTLQASEWRSRLIPPAGEPHWRDEVAAFRRDPSHPLGIWPNGWIIAMPHRTR